MKTLCIVICHCVNWQPVINAIPCVCWGILALVMLYFLLKHVVAPLIANGHENMMKSKAFEQEKFWAFFNQKEKPIKEELEKANGELHDLKKKEKDLDEGKSALKKEQDEYEMKILEAKVKAYEEILKKS